MKSDEDTLLLQRLKKGDETSFRSIYDKYHKPLYQSAFRYLRSKARAEDAVQDIFVKLWNNKKNLRRSGSLRGFLFTGLTNHVLNIMSRQKRRLKKEIQFSYETKMDCREKDNVIMLSEYRTIYKLAISRLPAKRREVFELREKEGLTNREVADYLDISIHTVKSQYQKALISIREYVADRIHPETGS